MSREDWTPEDHAIQAAYDLMNPRDGRYQIRVTVGGDGASGHPIALMHMQQALAKALMEARRND